MQQNYLLHTANNSITTTSRHENPEAFSLKKYNTLLALKELFYHCRTVSSKQSHSGSKRDERKSRPIRKLTCFSCAPIFITTHRKGLSAFLG